MTLSFEFGSLSSEETEFERDSHALFLSELYVILTDDSKRTRNQRLALAVQKMEQYALGKSPDDLYVHRADYNDDVEMLESQIAEHTNTISERDRTINTFEYDIREIQGELQAMEEERDAALLNLENAEADIDRLKGEVDAAEQDAHEAWDHVTELETS